VTRGRAVGRRAPGPRRVARLLAALAGAAGLLLGPPPAARAAADASVEEAQVTAIASQLRCVVCQNLSVADSPSEMARQMRDLIRERLAAGDSPARIRAFFVERYGEWVLLSPPARGLNLVLWLAPFAALVGGLALVVVLGRRWQRRRPEGGPGQPALEAGDRARIAAELERLRD
jgi:cytochrome c-type biogenesis protein CcmH